MRAVPGPAGQGRQPRRHGAARRRGRRPGRRPGAAAREVERLARRSRRCATRPSGSTRADRRGDGRLGADAPDQPDRRLSEHEFTPVLRGWARKIASAGSGSASSCWRWFFTRDAGKISRPVSRSISDQRSPPISSRRQAVSNNSRMMRQKSSSTLLQTLHTRRISSSLRTRSRAPDSSAWIVGVKAAFVSVLCQPLAHGPRVQCAQITPGTRAAWRPCALARSPSNAAT